MIYNFKTEAQSELSIMSYGSYGKPDIIDSKVFKPIQSASQSVSEHLLVAMTLIKKWEQNFFAEWKSLDREGYLAQFIEVKGSQIILTSVYDWSHQQLDAWDTDNENEFRGELILTPTVLKENKYIPLNPKLLQSSADFLKKQLRWR